jgi:uncharacterized membrane protein YhdT
MVDIHCLEGSPLSQEKILDPQLLHRGLAKVRSRRWILWTTILIYMPGMMLGLYLQASGGTMGKLFAGWVGLLCVAVGLATVVVCPQCGNTFHTNGPTFLPVRRCVHCGLHLCADKPPRSTGADRGEA